jgi:hypothetical protein
MGTSCVIGDLPVKNLQVQMLAVFDVLRLRGSARAAMARDRRVHVDEVGRECGVLRRLAGWLARRLFA